MIYLMVMLLIVGIPYMCCVICEIIERIRDWRY